MRIVYTARKVNLRDNFKERVEKKLQKFKKLFSEEAVVNVVVTLEKNRQTVEMTIRDKAMVYRAESTMPEMNDALDRVMDIMTRQIRKNKTRLEKRIKTGSLNDIIADIPEGEIEAEDEYKVVRAKQVIVKPLTIEEAILEMNMVNHDFFMFLNAETNDTLRRMTSTSYTSARTAITVFLSRRNKKNKHYGGGVSAPFSLRRKL